MQKDEIKEKIKAYYFANDIDKILDYITNLQIIADNRMNALLKIEKYCIDEKEDLCSGGEICEDVLKIIDELKGK